MNPWMLWVRISYLKYEKLEQNSYYKVLIFKANFLVMWISLINHSPMFNLNLRVRLVYSDLDLVFNLNLFMVVSRGSISLLWTFPLKFIYKFRGILIEGMMLGWSSAPCSRALSANYGLVCRCPIWKRGLPMRDWKFLYG